MLRVDACFHGEGFNRWCKIYGETDEVYPVQKDTWVGHEITVDKILVWLVSKSINGSQFVLLVAAQEAPRFLWLRAEPWRAGVTPARAKATLRPDAPIPS